MKQINRIVLFGDSFIQGTGCFYKLESDGRMVNHPSVNDHHNMELKKFQNENSWYIHLKKYFPNVDIINYGKDGCSNYEQFQNFRNYFHEIHKPDDLILFGFTSKYRDFSGEIIIARKGITAPILIISIRADIHIKRTKNNTCIFLIIEMWNQIFLV
mgnify:CR=1 FL=1